MLQVVREHKNGTFPAQVFERLSSLQTDIDWIKGLLESFPDLQKRTTVLETKQKLHSYLISFLLGSLSAIGAGILGLVLHRI